MNENREFSYRWQESKHASNRRGTRDVACYPGRAGSAFHFYGSSPLSNEKIDYGAR